MKSIGQDEGNVKRGVKHENNRKSEMPVQSNDPLSVRNLTNVKMTPGFTDGKKFNFELDANNDYSD